MTPSIRVNDALKRPMQYWGQDGIEELLFGLFFFVQGALVSWTYSLPRDSSIATVCSLTALALTVVFPIIFKRGTKLLKERITFLRCGYLALPEPTRGNRIVMFAVFGVIFVLQNIATQFPRLAGPGFAMFIAGSFLFSSIHYRMPHLQWLAAFSLLLSLWMYYTGSGTGMAGYWRVVFVLGLAGLFSGALRLRIFLKANPLPDASEA